MVGYAALLLLLLSVAAAARTDYNKGVLKVKMWSVLLAEALIVIGTVPRVHASKFRGYVAQSTVPANGNGEERRQ